MIFTAMIQQCWGSSDSIDKRLFNIKADTSRIKYLCDVVSELSKTDKEKARKYFLLLIEKSKSLDDFLLKSEAYRIIGVYYQESWDYNNAILYLNQANDFVLKVKAERRSIELGKVLSSLGNIYHFNGDFETALSYYLRADSAFRIQPDNKLLIRLYSSISEVYDRLKQFKKAGYYYQEILKLAQKTTDFESIVTAYITYANSVVDSGKYKVSEAYLFKALDLSISNNYPLGQLTAYYNLGYLESSRKNYRKALEYNKKVLQLAIKTVNYYDECDAYNKLGRNSFFLNEFKSAQGYLKQGISLARKHGFKELLRKNLDVAVNVEIALKNFEVALNYREEYTSLYLETVDSEIQQQINFLEAKYQAHKREAAITQLMNEKKIKDLQISRNKLWISGLLLIVLLLAVFAGSIHINYKHKRKIEQQESKLKEQKILELEKDRQLLATQSVLKGEETERSRLARDLHDGLGGLLLSIKLSLSSTKENMTFTEDGVDQYNKALGLLDTSMKELRRVAHNMMPEALVKFGLKDALADFSSLSNGDSSTQITFQSFGEEKRIDSRYEIGLYRIAQELINNALKYSKATELMVQLIQEADRVHLTVQDNGKGFDMEILKTSKGAGIANIKSRVESLNGYFDIYSEPDKGTEACIEFKNLSLQENQIIS